MAASPRLAWPPPSYTLRWWQVAATNQGVLVTAWTSVQVALVATAIAVVLGTLASMAPVRYEFFGKETVSLLVLLPIALPGIVTVVNNASSRLRRMSGTTEEAAMDLGAGPWTTWRLVTFPALRSALGAGALLAFAISFDEIIVTTSTAGPGIQTLPQWIFQNLFRPNQSPVVNVAAAVRVLISVPPVYLADRLSGGSAGAVST